MVVRLQHHTVGSVDKTRSPAGPHYTSKKTAPPSVIARPSTVRPQPYILQQQRYYYSCCCYFIPCYYYYLNTAMIHVTVIKSTIDTILHTATTYTPVLIL